jgi:hypothetical protein
MPMERNEAITCLKELLNVNSNLSPQAVSFQKPKDSTGYTLHIKGIFQQSDKQVVEEIAEKHSLAVKQESDGIIIFKPPPTNLLSKLFESIPNCINFYDKLFKPQK